GAIADSSVLHICANSGTALVEEIERHSICSHLAHGVEHMLEVARVLVPLVLAASAYGDFWIRLGHLGWLRRWRRYRIARTISELATCVRSIPALRVQPLIGIPVLPHRARRRSSFSPDAVATPSPLPLLSRPA